MVPSSMTELQQKRQQSRATSPEYKKGNPGTGSSSSSSSTSHRVGSKTISQSKNVHF